MLKDDRSTYETLMQARLNADEHYPNMNARECAMYLRNVGYPQEALKLARIALAGYESEQTPSLSPILRYTQKLIRELEEKTKIA